MIPKIIHFIWLGKKPLSDLAKKCIKSWKKYCPDYEIKMWNEDNFDINSIDYVKEAYEAGKFAFASDYIRLYVLVNYGGIYLDTDVEILKNMDSFLTLKSFAGFESNEAIGTGILGCEKANPLFSSFLDTYTGRRFLLKDGTFDMTTNVKIFTDLLLSSGLKLKNSLQENKLIKLFPNDYFCPTKVGKNKFLITKKTTTIHYFSGSWMSHKAKLLMKAKKIFGDKFVNTLINFNKK